MFSLRVVIERHRNNDWIVECHRYTMTTSCCCCSAYQDEGKIGKNSKRKLTESTSILINTFKIVHNMGTEGLRQLDMSACWSGPSLVIQSACCSCSCLCLKTICACVQCLLRGVSVVLTKYAYAFFFNRIRDPI